jgi:hypothetical protein
VKLPLQEGRQTYSENAKEDICRIDRIAYRKFERTEEKEMFKRLFIIKIPIVTNGTQRERMFVWNYIMKNTFGGAPYSLLFFL